MPPADRFSAADIDLTEELLVPAERAEKLRSEFVLRFQVIRERVRVTDARNLKTGLVNFRPDLQMMPGETCVLPHNQLPVIADITAGRQGLLGFSPEIGTVAHGKTKVPRLIRPETHPRTESRILKVNFGCVPRFRTRREERVL